jgi:phosphoglycolate phosphatase
MIKGIIFDMDGTILDTLTDIKLSVNHALSIKKYPLKTDEDIKKAVGNGAYKLIERVVPDYLLEQEIKEVFSLYQAYYDQNSNTHTKLYPNILRLLRTLKEYGFYLGVVSNKFEHLVNELNTKMFENLFDVSIGEVKGIPIKPNPDMLYKALKVLNLENSEVLFVGDSEVDMDTAKNANIVSVGVTWGFRDQELLIKHHAKYIINEPFELIDIIEEVNTL